MVTTRGATADRNDAARRAEAAGPEGMVAEDLIEFGDLSRKTQQSTFGAHFVEVGVDAFTAEVRVRRMLAEHYRRENRLPDIQVARFERDSDRSLVLRNQIYRGRPLADGEAEEVLRHLGRLWGFTVRLESVDADGKVQGTREWRFSYRGAYKRLRAGEPAVFPAGTYWLRRFANVPVESLDPPPKPLVPT